ncbi:MAG: hypothetical protein M0T74_01925 [Desulfitobacterium hafniense]|nr:hypothetical protein [Desulfitobacterium hafniense]
MKDKMIYIMNVDWNWIKQRPHFLAEGLSDIFDITVLYQYRYGRKGFQKRESRTLNLKPIYVVPRIDRYKRIRKLNDSIKSHVIRDIIKKQKPKYLFLTFPDQVSAIPKEFNGIVIYDCMDNHSAFIKDTKQRKRLEKQEATLMVRATAIFASSDKLRAVLTARYSVTTKISVVRNGYSGLILNGIQKSKIQKSEEFTICYFGTISSWFNFEFIEKSLKDFRNLHYLLIGPLAGVTVPTLERIHYTGTVEHDKLYEATKDADCFVMPFIVNEIIESVDPVKLYEYINFNKNIICVYYSEVKRFGDFVHFYTDYKSFKKQIETLIYNQQIKYSMQERITFLQENGWDIRVESIESTITKLRSNLKYENF